MSVVEIIQHYQRSIEKCSGNEERMMHCIAKLYRLPVTVQHLQETGVGRTINALRKYEGDVGEAAKALVAKWKMMVTDEESSEGDVASEDETNAQDPPEDHSNRSHYRKKEKDSSDDRKESRHRSHEPKDRHESKSNKNETSKHNSTNGSTETSQPKDSHNKSHSTSLTPKHKVRFELDKQESKSNSKHDKDRRDSKNDSRSDRKSKSDRDPKVDRDSINDKLDSKKEDKNKSIDKDKIKSSDSKKYSDKVSGSSRSSRDDRVNADNDRKRRLDSSSSGEISKKRKHSESESGEDMTQPFSASEDDNEKFMPELSEGSGSEEVVPKIEIKQEPPSPPPKSKDNSRKNDEIRNEKKSSKDKSKESHSTSKSKPSGTSDKSKRDDKEKKKREKEEEEDKTDHRKSEKRKDQEYHSNRESKSKSHSSSSSSCKDKIRDKDMDKDKHKDQHKVKKESKSGEPKDAKLSPGFKEPKEKKKIKKEVNGDEEGIDCNSGASFAEALGMCAFPMPVSRKRNNNSPNLSPVKTIKTELGTPSTSNSKPLIKVKTEPSLSTEASPPSLLAPNVKLEPLSVDLASTLPEISPNYKPLPYVNPVHRKQEEDRALSEVIYAKNQRTKVYSGNKCGYTNVPSLYEMCIRILIENIEALEFTGGVPFDIIKPVLERATPDQLYMLEHHNPYLIEDTDPLWKFHCTREFRTKKRDEMETWREMYMRCLDEREAKLKALTANIKQAQDKSLPVSKTKLAYVDNIVKPPRNVLRKQAKYGTAKATSSTSDLKHKLISGSGGSIPTNISVPPPPMGRSRTSSSGILKKTKAPLMAKALQLIKGRYKR